MMNDDHWMERVVGEEEVESPDQNGPYLTKVIKRTIVAFSWNPGYNQDLLCECGDPYYRHFDSYEEMRPIGCKYCECRVFRLPESST